MSWYNNIIEQLVKLKQLKMPRILRQECGSIIVFTAVAMSTLLGLAGLAYDVGNLYMHKARLQNVADAAVYAGARAYVNSQTKPQGERDGLDNFVDLYTSAKEAVDFSINDNPQSKNRTGSPHPDADKAADDYIYKNIVNLGTTVSTDGYSHYALLSKEDNPKTFYRIGLYEYVDLHFLPVIRGIGKTQRVGVESIAMISEETGAPIPATIFSNLATYNGTLTTEGTVTDSTTEQLNTKPGDGGATIQTTFDGELIHTGNKSDYFNPEGNIQNLYTDDAKKAQTTQNLSVTEINNTANDTDAKYVNNPKKSAIIVNDDSLEDYMNILRSKMELPNIKLNMADPEDAAKFTTDYINGKDSNSLYKLEEIDKEGNRLYTIKFFDNFYTWRYFTFSVDPTINPDTTDIDLINRRFYSYNDLQEKMYLLQIDLGGQLVRIPSYLEPENEELKPEGGFPCTVNNRTYEGNYVKDSDGNITYYYIDTVTKKAYFATIKINKNKRVLNEVLKDVAIAPVLPKHVRENNPERNTQHVKYTVNDTTSVTGKRNILINFMSYDNSLFNTLNQNILEYNTNIFHLVNSTSEPITNLTLTFDDEIEGRGNKSEPIYIFDDTNAETTINVTKSNVRPIMIVHSGEKEVKIKVSDDVTFDGALYAPKAIGTIILNNNSAFAGNIVAYNIHFANTGRSSSYKQKNYLETDTNLYNAVIEYAVKTEQLFGEASATMDASGYYDKPPTNTYTASWENWYSMVGNEKAASWFNSLTDSQKISFWKSWDIENRPKNKDDVYDDYIAGLREQWYDENYWKKDWFFAWDPRQDIADTEYGNRVYQEERQALYFVRDSVFNTEVRLINPRNEYNPFTKLSK